MKAMKRWTALAPAMATALALASCRRRKRQ